MSVLYFSIYFNYKNKYFAPRKCTHKIRKLRELTMKAIYTIPAAMLLAGASTAALAAPQLYLGAQMGYQSTDMEYSDKYSDDFGSNVKTTDYSVDGVAGGIFAGAKFYVAEGLYIAPEVNLSTSTADGGNEENWSYPGYATGDYKQEVEAGTSYGLSVLFGKDLTASTTVYGRLGYQRTEYEVTVSGSNRDTMSEDETFGGVRYGIGMETDLAERLALRLDWSQTQYSDESFSETTIDPFGGSFTETDTFEPTESLFQAGVVYKF